MTNDELAERTRAYIERGRRLERSSDYAVLDDWISTTERWYEHPTTEDARSMDDAAAELRLRGFDAR
jgi:hypothetical protein